MDSNELRRWLVGACALALLSLVMLFHLAACSMFQQGARNVTAANCHDLASMQAFVSNLPPNPFLTGTQQLAVQEQICAAMFGTVAAPATAAGNAPAIPAPATGK